MSHPISLPITLPAKSGVRLSDRPPFLHGRLSTPSMLLRGQHIPRLDKIRAVRIRGHLANHILKPHHAQSLLAILLGKPPASCGRAQAQKLRSLLFEDRASVVI